MIRKLKRRFILTSMTVVTLVLLLVCFALGLGARRVIYSDADQMLKRSLMASLGERPGGRNERAVVLQIDPETGDRVRGLDSGGDYYLTKPFEMSELLACVRALTRRQGEVVMDELSFGELKLNLSTGDLSYGDKKVRLGKKEFSIMRIFLSNGEAIVSKETLINKVWGYESDAEDNNVEVYISFLRKKLAFLKAPVQIATLRKFGYRLEAAEK